MKTLNFYAYPQGIHVIYPRKVVLTCLYLLICDMALIQYGVMEKETTETSTSGCGEDNIFCSRRTWDCDLER